MARPPVISVHIRLPRTLHEKLSALAADEGVSLSLLAATLLAAAVPFDFRETDEMAESEPNDGLETAESGELGDER